MNAKRFYTIFLQTLIFYKNSFVKSQKPKMKNIASSFRSKDTTKSMPLFLPQNYFYSTSVNCKHLVIEYQNVYFCFSYTRRNYIIDL